MLQLLAFEGGRLAALIVTVVLVGICFFGLIAGAVYGVVSDKRARKAEEAAEPPKDEPAPAEETETPAEEPAAPQPAVEEPEETEAPVEEPAEEPAEETEEAEEETEEIPAVLAEAAPAAAETAEETAPTAPKEDPAGEIVAVKDMSAELRAALGLSDPAHDGEWYSVKYSYGFNARIALASEEVRGYYTAIVNEIAAYDKMKRAESWRQQRIYTGREKLGVILFKGKKLCLALALDPKEYADTKYRGKDASGMHRFADTPMLFPIGSARKLKYAQYLIGELAKKHGLARREGEKQTLSVPEKTRDELIAEKQIKALGRRVPAPEEN